MDEKNECIHMLKTIFIIIPLFTVSTVVAQNPSLLKLQKSKIFISDHLEYLEILNDTLLCSSLNSYADTAFYFFNNDTLCIGQTYRETDQTGTKEIERLYDYKMLKCTADTIILENIFRYFNKPDNWEDTLVLVNIEKQKEPVDNFRALKLDFFNPWSGEKKIIIDNKGRVTFIDTTTITLDRFLSPDRETKKQLFTGSFTPEEFIIFKNLLSRSLPSKLPPERNCPMDGAVSNFEIRLGARTITSTGCTLSRVHYILLDYLLGLDQNKGIVKKSELH
ncbi:hypothetical protein LQ567_19235 [Niabella pedocola]|uniref:Uncharacterized protein n=1 Tax=Niabella pedocola TaxID=1752077 RepID=A0ABS8PYC9_9BACT|nr:hypothetical protein [Niabella pedocola]MCD2424926.1 hypothetical protein [Niabella pedocola]